VTGHARLFDDREQGVAVAVEAKLPNLLGVAGGPTLVPQFLRERLKNQVNPVSMVLRSDSSFI
jgi:hypothetical protein